MKKGKRHTPAEVAEKLAKYIAKQEETLGRFPVGPMANTAKMNLQKAAAAMDALKATNEQMRMASEQSQMQVGMPSGAPKMVQGGETFELGLRNNNPGNLRQWGGNEVRDGFAVFNSPQEGWQALLEQLQRYQQGKTPGTSGNMTLAQAMAKYAPKFENDTNGYINTLVGYLNNAGIDVTADTPIQRIPTEEWAAAVSRVESPQMYSALQQQNLLPPNMVQAIPAVPDSAVQAASSYLTERGFGAADEWWDDSAVDTPSQPAINPEDVAGIPDFMLSPEARAAKEAASAIPSSAGPVVNPLLPTPDPTVGDPSVTQANPQAVGMKSEMTNFNSAKRVGNEQFVPGTNIAYARNEFGDYNVYLPDREQPGADNKFSDFGGFYGQYVIRASDWSGPESIDKLVRESRAIPYSESVDGFTTKEDWLNLLTSPLSDPTPFNEQLAKEAAALAGTMGNYQSGMNYDFAHVAQLVAEERGIKPPKQTTRMSPSGNNAQVIYDEEDKARYDAEMAVIYGEIASNPGSYVWEDEEGNDHVGVGGYSPFSDYVAYNTGDVEFQTRYQNRQQTNSLVGQFLLPGGFKAFRATALGRGANAIGTTFSDDAAKALAAGNTDEALRIAGSEAPKALPQGRLALPAPKNPAGPPVKGVEGMRFKPGTAAAGEPPTFVPANNAAGRQVRLTPNTTVATRNSMTAGEQIANSGVNVLDDGTGVFTSIPGQGIARPGQFLPVPSGSAVPAPGTKAATDLRPFLNYKVEDGLARVAGMNQAPARISQGLIDDFGNMARSARAARIEQAARSVFGTAAQGAMLYDPQFDPRILQEDGLIPKDGLPVKDSTLEIPGAGEGVGTAPIDGGIGGNTEIPVSPGLSPGDGYNIPPGDTVNLKMGNMSPLMAIPALAAMNSARIQREALGKMEGPARPEELAIRQFDYESNVGQQIADAQAATNAMARNTNLSSGAAAANRQGLLAQRFGMQNQVRTQDQQMRTQARMSYDTQADAVRAANNVMRNRFTQDSVDFNNKMAQLEATVKQQPMSVLSSAAQDYLKNVYANNQQLALAQLGRFYDTSAPQSQG